MRGSNRFTRHVVDAGMVVLHDPDGPHSSLQTWSTEGYAPVRGFPILNRARTQCRAATGLRLPGGQRGIEASGFALPYIPRVYWRDRR